ncbi:SLC43A3 [Branchiostoma lanceolatum]|uniref:SLC43A3 protein n=1 Tax=Branchiostoma lanceolatum TaxID=7740 RepID=A0A8J9VXZ9_BRALA|nr:SLC43A3 [Branchiostoma lanceolatum]
MPGAGPAQAAGSPRYLLLFIAVVETLLFSGVFFGWASLVYVLKADGFFTYLCDAAPVGGNNVSSLVENGTDNWTASQGANGTALPTVVGCDAQNSQFSLIFTLTTNMFAFGSVLAGLLFDTAGIKWTRVCWALCAALGAALLGSAQPDEPLVHLVLPAMLVYALGANCVLLSNMAVGDLFGDKKSTVVTLIAGAFDSSSAVFLLLKILYMDAGFPFHVFCYLLAALSMLSLIPTFFLFPNKSFQNNNDNEEEETTDDETPEMYSGSDDKPKFRQIVTSGLFLSHVLYMCVENLSINFVIGSANGWFNTLTGQQPDKVNLWTNIFGYFMMAGLLLDPITGLVNDRALKLNIRLEGDNPRARQLASIPVFTICVTLTTLLYAFLTLSVIEPRRVEEVMGLSLVSTSDMFIMFLVVVISRGFVYGGNVSFIANAFPPEYTGRLYACVLCGMGVINTLQIPLMMWVQQNDDNPLYVYILLLCMNLLAAAHPISVSRYCRNNKVLPTAEVTPSTSNIDSATKLGKVSFIKVKEMAPMTEVEE